MERYKSLGNEEDQSSSDTEKDVLHPATTKKRYTQKFRKSWLNDPRLSNWIAEGNDGEVECKYCNSVIKAKLSSLLNHANTSKHVAVAPPVEYNQSPETHKNQEKYSSSDSEDISLSRAGKRRYTQKFRQSWLTDPRLSNWITETNHDEVECKFCNCAIKSKLSSLLNHAKSSKHEAAALLLENYNPPPLENNNPPLFENNNQETLEFKPEQLLADIIECDNQEESSSTDSDEDVSLSGTSKKRYTQKFRQIWLSDPRLSNWIIKTNDGEVKCKYCNRIIKAKLSSLLNHAKTSNHVAAAPPLELKQKTHQPVESHHQEESSSSDSEEDASLSGSGKKKYIQKFRKSWLCDIRLAHWIVETDDKMVKCKYCNCVIKSRLSNLLRHLKTTKHMTLTSHLKSDNQEALGVHAEKYQTVEHSKQEVSSSSETMKDSSFSRTSKEERWLRDPRFENWIIKTDDNKLKCNYCNCVIKPKLSRLLSHGKSSKHMAVASAWKDNDDDGIEFLIIEEQPTDNLLEESSYSSDTEENVSMAGSKKRKYKQKFRESWFTDPRLSDWIIQMKNNKVKCRYCDCVVKPKLSNLIRHLKTSKHMAVASVMKNKKSQENTELKPLSMTSLNPDLSKPTCRVCLQNYNDEEMTSIFDVDVEFNNLYIFEKIEQCAAIKVLRHEKMPTSICGDCYGFLKVSYKFRTICRNSNEYLKEFIFVGADTEKIYVSPNHNPLSVTEKNLTEDSSIKQIKTLQNKTKLGERPNLEPQNIKNEQISPCSSRRNSEDFTGNEFDSDHADMWFDINYNDDDDDISCGENMDVSVEKLDFDIKEENLNEIKSPIIKAKKKAIPKEKKKSTATLSKTLEISADGSAIIREKKPRGKREKKEKQPQICDICGNIYQRRYSLELHMRRHRAEKPYECEICGYAFHSNFEIIRHMRKHTGVKPYKCSFCDRAFGDQSTLIKHERIHRNERPFKCETCGKSFTYSNVLKYHKYVHTGEKPYSCELCGKCFTRPHHLRAHLETLQHQSDPRSKILIQNIKKKNDETSIIKAII